MSVRTRFAPSPTGYLHIGGVRTALFNWLFARRHGGQFILRIDDTDASRHVEEAVQLIQDGFRWIGMNWDEGPVIGGPNAPYFQSQRRPIYDKALQQLIETGHAYPCLAEPATIDAEREAAKTAKRPFVYRGPNRDMAPAEALQVFRDKKPALRFKVPIGKTTVLEDKIRGRVEWQTDLLGDFTIARSGGDPLYNLASIVDDIDMKITHIIRAEEHLTNTHPQLLIAQALGAELPTFAHLPYVAEPGTKKKLSKRNPPPGVMVALEDYEKVGYLPAAIVNAIARLGWSLDDKSEIIALDTIIANFSLEHVTSAPAGLDIDKMFWMQDHYMRALAPEERVRMMLPFLQREKLISDPATLEQIETVRKIDIACGDRIKLLGDIVRYGGFCFADKLTFEKTALKNLKKDGVAEQLKALIESIGAIPVESFSAGEVEAKAKAVAEALGVGGKINHALRAGLTGQSVGPGVYDCAAILGKEKSIRNLQQTLADLESNQLTEATSVPVINTVVSK